MAKVVAHRGYAQICPENTIIAFEHAVAAGAQHVELDVQLTRDHVPVVIHDASLQRTGDRNVDVLSSTWAEIAQFSVGEQQRFGLTYGNIKLPSLADFVEFLQRFSQVTAYVEIKDESVDMFGCQQVVEHVLKILAPVLDQCVVIGYSLQVIAAVREMSDLKVGWVLTKYDDASHQLAQQIVPDYIICNYQKIPDQTTSPWPGTWSWILYEITEREIAYKWRDRGVDFIETMDVGQLYTDLLDR